MPRVMGAASAGAAGAKGLVPAPAAGDEGKFLRGDKTWQAAGTLSTASEAQEVAAASTSVASTPGRVGLAVGRVVNTKAPRGGVAFDGTSTAKLKSTLTSQSIATDPFTVVLTFKCLSSNPSGNIALVEISSATGAGDQANSVLILIDSSGHLQMLLYGSPISNYRYSYIANFVTTYAGKVVQLVFGRDSSGAFAYVNGTAATLSAGATGGTPPAWATESITSTYFYVGGAGGTPYANQMYSASLYNLALSAADVLEIYELGGAVPYRYQWGTQTNSYASDFSAGVDSWGNQSDSNTLTGNTDSINGQDDWLKIERTVVGTGRLDITRTVSAMSMGKAFRLQARLFNPAGSTIDGISFGVDGNDLGVVITSLPANSQVDLDRVGVRTTTGTMRLGAYTGGNFSGNANGQFVYAKTIKATPAGAVVHLPLDEGIGFQLHDASTNKLDAVMTTTGVTHLIPKRQGYVRTPGSGLSWSAAHDAKNILGAASTQRMLPNGAVLTLATLKSSAGTSGAGASLRSTNTAARWSSAAALTTTKSVRTLANQLPAGTADADNDILLDPDDANITATIAAEVHYKLTEGDPA